MKTKLIRNLKKGDQFTVFDCDYRRHQTVTVQCVQETRRGFMTGKRMWQVIGDFPWWFACGVTGYHNDKIEVNTK